MNNFLVCHQVSKAYQEGGNSTPVLNQVDFTLAKGELAAIVGSSGSGKSTLLHILGALDTPDHGEVVISGQSLTQMSQNQQAKFRNQYVGFIYQFHHLLADFSALENIMMPQLIGGETRSKAQQKASRLLDRVGLSHRNHHRPSELSGGERQRVAIARALINNPALLLADEPTGNLDHATALAIYDLIRELNHEYQSACVVVTHDNELATKMDRQYLMQNGQLVTA